MKTIILILGAIATMSFAMCLDAEGQPLPLPERQADSRTPLPVQFRISVEKGIIILTDVNSGKVMGRTTFERWELLHQHKINSAMWPLTSPRPESREMGAGNASLTPFTRFTQ